MENNFNKISCIEAKIIQKSGRPYLYYKGLLSNGLVVTVPYISLDDISLKKNIGLTLDFNTLKTEENNRKISFEVQATEDDCMFTIENSYMVGTELRIFYKNEIRKVKITHAIARYDSKENCTYIDYVLEFIDKMIPGYIASIKLREAELREKEVL